MHLRLASALPQRSSLGDGVHKAPSPFCKAGTKRYMLCPYAYGTVDSRVTCRSGVRRSNRMEVGRRQGRHSLQRSARTRRTACGNLWRLTSGLHSPAHAVLVAIGNSSTQQSVSKLRNLEARSAGDDREFRRCGGSGAPLRAGNAVRSFSVPVYRRSAGARFPAQRARPHAERSSARISQPSCSYSRQSRKANRGITFGGVLRASGIDSSTTSRSRAPATTEATRTRSGQQVAYEAAQLRGTERCEPDDQSADEQTRSTVIRSGGYSSPADSHCLALRAQFFTARMRRATD
jgi:hypothetical protein